MTKQLFFDTDCLSSFLWVGREDIMLSLYKGYIVFPKTVLDELSRVPKLYQKAINLVNNGDVLIQDIYFGTNEYKDFIKYTLNPDAGKRTIGDGEAAVLALATHNNGIVASNNLKDITVYVKELGLEHVTTGDILYVALKDNIISEAEGNKIWNDMISKRRILPTASFTDFIRKYKIHNKSV